MEVLRILAEENAGSNFGPNPGRAPKYVMDKKVKQKLSKTYLEAECQNPPYSNCKAYLLHVTSSLFWLSKVGLGI